MIEYEFIEIVEIFSVWETAPLIFTAKIKEKIYLLYNFDYNVFNIRDNFIVFDVTEREIDFLKNGKISLRGIMNNPLKIVIIEINYLNNIRMSYIADYSEYYHKYLPPYGVGLHHNFGVCPDIIIEEKNMKKKYDPPSYSYDEDDDMDSYPVNCKINSNGEIELMWEDNKEFIIALSLKDAEDMIKYLTDAVKEVKENFRLKMVQI